MLKLSSLALCSVWMLGAWMGVALLDALCTFPQGSRGFPYVPLIVIHLFTLVAVDDIALVVLGVLVLWSDQHLFYGSTSLEVCLYPISATGLL